MVRITNRAPFSFYLASVMLGCAGYNAGQVPAFIDVDETKLPEGERAQLAAWQPLGVSVEALPPGSPATQPGVQPGGMGTAPQPPPPAPVMAPPAPPAPFVAPPAPVMPPAPPAPVIPR